MKKIILITGLLLVLLWLFYSSYIDKRNKYYTIVNTYEWESRNNNLIADLASYFAENGYLPTTLSDIDTIYSYPPNTVTFNGQKIDLGSDKFIEESRYYFYQPIYNSTSKNVESYYLLSGGIDGAINNFHTTQDTIYEEEVGDLKFYEIDSTNYNFLDFHLGDKDILLSSFSIKKDYYKYKGFNTSLSKVLTRSKKRPNNNRHLNMPFAFKGHLEAFDSVNNIATIKVNDTINVVASVYHQEYFSFAKFKNTELNIKGIFHAYDSSSNSLMFINAIIEN